MSEIENNLKKINSKIEITAKAWGRSSGDINLVAVSKRQSIDKIQEALDCGHRVFGENKVQEAYEHWEGIKINYPDLELHMIGHLQTNKVKEAVALFDVIETIDREKLAKEVSKEIKKQGRDICCFIQVNTGREEQKGGVDTKNLRKLYDYCIDECGLNIIGLMCIPPVGEASGLHFAFLNKLANDLGLDDLSMGMSSDFDVAIASRASHIRIGTLMFGNRS